MNSIVVACARQLLSFFITIAFVSALFPSIGIQATVAYAAAKFTITATVQSPNGKLKGRGTSKVAKGKSKTFVATPKKGFKAGILVNGYLVRFQTDGKIKKANKSKVKGARDLKYVIKKVKANTTVKAIFIPVGKSFADGMGITFVGLGATIRVTNLAPAPVQGVSESTIGVKSVSWQNLTNGAQGAASGTTAWTATIPLALGDNKVIASMVAADGTPFQTTATITFYPNLDFSGPLAVTDDVLFVNEGKSVRFYISLKDPTDAVVTLVSVNAEGVEDGVVSQPMLDDGVLPDEIQKDGVFTAEVSVLGTVKDFKYFRVKVAKPSGTYYSEVQQIWVTEHLTSADVQIIIDLANGADAQYKQLMGTGSSEADAFAAIVEAIKANPSVGAAGVGPLGGVWWITTKGVLGTYTARKDGLKGGGAGVPRGSAPVPVQQIKAGGASPFSYYRNDDLVWVTDGNFGLSAFSPAPPENRVKSKKGLIISPFISNPSVSANNSFGNADDYFSPWQTLINKGSECTVKADTEILNNGSNLVTTESFKTLAPYGVVHISTHGDNLYNGLLSLWQNVWGPNDWLKGYFSVVILHTGVILPTNPDNTIDISGYEADLLGKRLAVDTGGWLAATPAFFQMYVGQLPKSLVILSACRSAYNASLANVFLGKGAQAVLGYTDYVLTSYAQNTLNEIYTLMLQDKTIKEAFDSAVSKFGAADTSTPPATFVRYGQDDLKFPSGDLENGGFEDTGLTPWEKDGDGRVVQQLGSTAPVEGSAMGIVSTGLGFTTASGSLNQVFCVKPDAQSLDMSWNFFSEEFKEYCNTQYQDFFTVNVCEIPDGGGAEICSPALSTNIDALCGGVFPVDVGFDRGGVYATGWRQLSFPLASYVGKKVRLRLIAGDVGDSIYDSAILVDNITVTKAGTP